MSLAPIVALAGDPEWHTAAVRYNERLADLENLEAAIRSDRYRNGRPGGLFHGPPPPIPTEKRELRVIELREELRRERARIAAACTTWGTLGGTPSILK